jgi:HPt (histidine-containing phosphotransfer) domain-containing protein
MPTAKRAAQMKNAPSSALLLNPGDLGDLPLLDQETLRLLAKELSPGAVRSFLRMFLSDTTRRLDEINALASSNDIDEVACLAHDLVSTAGNVGALQLSAVARALTRACRNKDNDQLQQFLKQVSVAAYATCLEVQKRLNAS